jgi:hypothetical protein
VARSSLGELSPLSSDDDHIHLPATARGTDKSVAPIEDAGPGAPYCRAISAGSGSTWWLHALHHTINRTFAFAALPSVIGGPGGGLMSLPL